MNKNSIAGMVVALALGLAVGVWWKPQPAPSVAPTAPVACEGESSLTCDEKLNALKSKFESISEKDIDEYIKLKDMKAKYEKADEIFGKILSIFLLDLGMRVSGQKLEELKQASAAPRAEPASSSADDELYPASKSAPRSSSQAAVPARVPKQVNPNRVTSEEEAKKLLEEAVSDPIASWDGSAALNRQQVRMINGVFAGQVTYDDVQKVALDVDIDVNAKLDESGELIGQLRMKVVSRDGNSSWSTTRDSGESIKQFRAAADGAILIETKGGDGIFQLYFMRNLKTFYGNFYDKSGLGKLKKVGIVTLTKRG